MKVISLKLRKLEKEDSNSMVTIMREISKMVNLKVKANITLQTQERFIKENFMKITY